MPHYRTRDALGVPEDPLCKSPFLLSWGGILVVLKYPAARSRRTSWRPRLPAGSPRGRLGDVKAVHRAPACPGIRGGQKLFELVPPPP